MDELLEREAELGALQRVAAGLAGGRGGFVFVAGEAGIGKTSLLRALRERLPSAVTFLLGACEPLSVPTPLAPLREISHAAAGTDIAELDSTDRIVLARALLDALEDRAPVLAVVEDAHWADPSTLDVLRLLPRRIEERPIAVVVTYRDDEAPSNQPLQSLLGDLATNPVVVRLSLRPLSERAVRELAAPVGADADRVIDLTGGNPFLVTEMVAGGSRLPTSVRDAVLARVGRLEPEARAVVEAAAVIGAKIDPRVLEQVAPGSAGGVEQALARGVLVSEDHALGFRHELIRVAVEAAIPAPARRDLHARVVAAFESSEGPVDHARLAHHAELAGMLDVAAAHARHAAEEAQRVGALREVALQTDRALRLAARLTDADRFELLVTLALAANFTSARLEDAREVADEAVQLAVTMADPVREGRAQMARAAALWSLDEVTEARAAAQRAVDVLESTEDLELQTRAYGTLIRMEATAFDPQAALDLAARALASIEQSHLEDVRIDIEISLGLARGHQGDPEALPMLEHASASARRASLTIPTVRSYVNMVYLGALQRAHRFVDEKTAEGLKLFEEVGTTIPGYAVDFYRARSLFDRGRWDEALAIASRSDRDLVTETTVALSLRGLIAARRGEPGASELLSSAWEELRQVPESSRHGTVRAALVEAAWLHGDFDAVHAQLADARRAPEPWRFARSGGDLAVWGARSGSPVEPPPGAPEPVHLEVAGDWRRAVAAWRDLEAPYEAALAALPGDEQAGREAMATFRRLGAEASARAFVRARSAFGGRLPRGPRRSTLAHPAGLTRREQQILEALATGATNAAIAAALHLSERTVAHHVSAVIAKLEVSSRMAAVERARSMGLLAQSGQGRPPR